MRGRLGAGRLEAADYASGLLGARGKKKFFCQKKVFFSRNKADYASGLLGARGKKKFFCQKKVFFFKK